MKRKESNSIRVLGTSNNLIDFSSNDYLGFSKNSEIFENVHKVLKEYDLRHTGATGSRLLTGNHRLYDSVETFVANFHNADESLIYNSGYDANIGFFSSIPQRGDVILYDELCHASIRDGIKMSDAKEYKFKHNDLEDLERRLQQVEANFNEGQIYVATESVFSMDGDMPELRVMVTMCKNYNALLIVDEAHALGVFGENGAGLSQELGIEREVFARIITFGKALGCHGAAVLGSKELKEYLVNFSRSFIYTTGLPPHSLAAILSGYQIMIKEKYFKQKLHINIAILQLDVKLSNLGSNFITSRSAIHSCIVPGNDKVKSLSEELRKNGFDVKAILSPTVPEGSERLRICLHTFNTELEIKKLVSLIANTLIGDIV